MSELNCRRSVTVEDIQAIDTRLLPTKNPEQGRNCGGDPDTLAMILFGWRESLGELANVLGVKQQTLSAWVSGRYRPEIREAMNLLLEGAREALLPSVANGEERFIRRLIDDVDNDDREVAYRAGDRLLALSSDMHKARTATQTEVPAGGIQITSGGAPLQVVMSGRTADDILSGIRTGPPVDGRQAQKVRGTDGSDPVPVSDCVEAKANGALPPQLCAETDRSGDDPPG